MPVMFSLRSWSTQDGVWKSALRRSASVFLNRSRGHNERQQVVSTGDESPRFSRRPVGARRGFFVACRSPRRPHASSRLRQHALHHALVRSRARSHTQTGAFFAERLDLPVRNGRLLGLFLFTNAAYVHTHSSTSAQLRNAASSSNECR